MLVAGLMYNQLWQVYVVGTSPETWRRQNAIRLLSAAFLLRRVTATAWSSAACNADVDG